MSREVMEVREAAADSAAQVDQNVPAGYKRTEVGVIPEDWNILTLEEICSSINDGTHHTPAYVPAGIPFYSVENVVANDFDDVKYISIDEHQKLVKRCAPQKGDILLTRIGTLGVTCLIDWDVEASIYVSLALLKLNEVVLPEYVYQYSKSESFIKEIEKRSLTNATPQKINMGDIGSVPLPVPSQREEQRAIATALSDVDALITALDRLIAKKRAIKTAAMQQLLTGKTRLPGFSGEWETKRLGDVADIVSGGTPKSGIPEYWDGGICWCTPTDITKTRGKYIAATDRAISKKGLTASSANLLPAGTILLCTRATIGEMKIAKVPIATNQGFKSLICKDSINNEFLYYKLQMEKVRLIEKASGSTFLEISKKDVVNFGLSIPKSEEQTAIAQILSDMDAEIAALEARRDKTRAIKQGMMQELLTGRTRLVEPESTEAA